MCFHTGYSSEKKSVKVYIFRSTNDLISRRLMLDITCLTTVTLSRTYDRNELKGEKRNPARLISARLRNHSAPHRSFRGKTKHAPSFALAQRSKISGAIRQKKKEAHAERSPRLPLRSPMQGRAGKHALVSIASLESQPALLSGGRSG